MRRPSDLGTPFPVAVAAAIVALAAALSQSPSPNPAISTTSDSGQNSPSDVFLIVSGGQTGWREAVQRLQHHLQASPEVKLLGTTEVPEEAPAAPDLSAPRRTLDSAEEEFTALNIGAAIDALDAAQNALLAHLDNPKATRLLAETFRTRGLVHLYLEESAKAAEAFGAAALLDPTFSPGRDQWPPDSRLAYADAVASIRKGAKGALTVRVQPKHAWLWVDGKPAGLGDTTVSEMSPGIHFVMARAPGHRRFAAMVRVRGGAVLDEASVFLQEAAGADIAARVALNVSEAFGSRNEAQVVRQAMSALGTTRLALVAPDPVTPAQPVVWLLNEQGKRDGTYITLTTVDSPVAVEQRILGREGAVAEDGRPWYRSWVVWTVVGGVVAAGVTTGIILGTREPTSNVSLFVGNP